MSEMPEIKKEDSTLPTPSEKKTEDSSEGLNPPAHEEKVKIINPEDDNDSVVPVPLTKQVIEVVATRKGFYGQVRISEGTKFSVASFDDLGEWMKCTDKEIEKKRVKFLKDKKAKK